MSTYTAPLRYAAKLQLMLATAALPQLACAFGLEDVARIAAERASQPFQSAPISVPQALRAPTLTYDQYRDIRFRPARALWRGESDFEAMYFHLGLYQTEPVILNQITADGVHHIHYQPADFDYGKNRFDTRSWGDLGYAGFRLHYNLNSPDYKDELVVFLGASYFRALGKGQQYGLSARGLAIDTVGGKAEEFPRFTEFWLEKPEQGANPAVVTVYALLESPRATGAYRFDIQPGEQTTTTVTAQVYLRKHVASAIATLGLAPLTSMFFSGENQPNAQDYRPEVHDSDGLMVASGTGEWLWRPLQNPKSPLVTSFALDQLKGFGLMQRDRAYTSYEDPEARYERRPSAWVEPLGDWGPGRVELLQLPTPDETHDNIVAYWVPDTLPRAGEPLAFSYRVYWQGDQQQRPPAAWATQSRRGMGYTALSAEERRQQVQYVIDFTGPALDALPDNAEVQAVVSSDDNGEILEQHAYRNAGNGQWRLLLRVKRLNAAQPIEVRAFLKHETDTVSETWSTIILPE